MGTIPQLQILIILIIGIESRDLGVYIPTNISTCLKNISTKVNTECAGMKNTFKYHCLPYDFSYDLGNICIEWKWIYPDRCPYLNSFQKQLDERKCESEFECPKELYKSYESYKYEACFRQFKPTTSPPPTTIESNDLTTALTTQKQNIPMEENVTKEEDNTTNGIGSEKTGLQETSAGSLMAIAIGAMMTAGCSILLTYYICKRKNQSDIEKGRFLPSDKTESSIPLCSSTKQDNTSNEDSLPKIGSTEPLSDSEDKNEESNPPNDGAYSKPESEIENEEKKPLLQDEAQLEIKKFKKAETQMMLQLAVLLLKAISKLLFAVIDNVTGDTFEKIVQRKDVREYLSEKFKSQPYILTNLSEDGNDDGSEKSDESINRDEVPNQVLYSILMEMIPELKDDDRNEIKILKEGRDHFQELVGKISLEEFEKSWEKTKTCIKHLDSKYKSGSYEELDKSEREVRDKTKQDNNQDSDVEDSDQSITVAEGTKLQTFMKLAHIIRGAIFKLLCNIIEHEWNSQLTDILCKEDIADFLHVKLEPHEYSLLYGEDRRPVMENVTCSILFSIAEECIELSVETVTEIQKLKTGRSYFDEIKGTEEEEEVKEKWIELAKSVKVLDSLYQTGVYKDLCDDAKQYMPKLE